MSHDIHRYDLIKDGRLLESEFEEFHLRYYDPAEFQALLEECGFVGVHRHKTYAFEAPGDTDETIVFECAKA